MDIYEINKNLQSEFALKKIKAEAIANNNQAKANSHIGYAKLKSLEREITFSLAKEQSAEKPNKKTINELEKSLSKTKSEMSKVLSSLKLSEEDLKPKYCCPKCKDSGFVGGKMCECFLKRRNEMIIAECGLKKDELSSFDDFDESLFASESQKNDSIKLKNLLENWCNNYPNIKKNKIVLIGETGVGKTFITKCMAKALLDKNLSVCFVSAFEMNNIMLKYHTTFDQTKLSILSPLLESDILFVDDLGTEPVINNVTLNYLFLILSERERYKKATIITSNLDIVDLEGRYGERIYSRVSDKNSGIILKLSGEDLRTKKR